MAKKRKNKRTSKRKSEFLYQEEMYPKKSKSPWIQEDLKL